MATLNDRPVRDLDTLAQFEAAMTLEQRLPERSILDVFICAAARQPERTAITLLMSGALDAQPRRVNYHPPSASVSGRLPAAACTRSMA